MPTYPVVNKVTGKKKELRMSMMEYSKWKDDNPDWDKDWSAGVAGVAEVGEWKTKVDGGFKDVLTNIKNHHPGATFEV